MLNYFLVSSALSSEKGSCYAAVKSSENLQMDDIIDQMLAEGSGLTRPQVLAYMEKFSEVLLNNLQKGYTITTPLFIIKPVINGRFNDPEDKFDTKRHQVNFRLASGKKLHEIKKLVKVKKTAPSDKSPIIRTIADGLNQHWINETVSGSIGMLRGKNLKFDKHDALQGLFFVPENGDGKAVRVSIYAEIKPGMIAFQIPVLNAGDYRLKVSAIPVNCKNLRKGVSEFIVTVNDVNKDHATVK